MGTRIYRTITENVPYKSDKVARTVNYADRERAGVRGGTIHTVIEVDGDATHTLQVDAEGTKVLIDLLTTGLKLQMGGTVNGYVPTAEDLKRTALIESWLHDLGVDALNIALYKNYLI